MSKHDPPCQGGCTQVRAALSEKYQRFVRATRAMDLSRAHAKRLIPKMNKCKPRCKVRVLWSEPCVLCVMHCLPYEYQRRLCFEPCKGPHITSIAWACQDALLWQFSNRIYLNYPSLWIFLGVLRRFYVQDWNPKISYIYPFDSKLEKSLGYPMALEISWLFEILGIFWKKWACELSKLHLP